MIIRISLGMLAYVFTSLFFGKVSSPEMLGLSIFFILLPLADWGPYLLIRKKYKLVSHYLWYFPLVYVPVGAAIVFFVSKNAYYVALFIVCSLANFIHATFRTPAGLQWFWPFSQKSISLYGNALKVFSKKERQQYLNMKYEEYERRSFQKNGMRTLEEEIADRKHPMGWKTISLLIIAILAVLAF